MAWSNNLSFLELEVSYNKIYNIQVTLSTLLNGDMNLQLSATPGPFDITMKRTP